MDRLFPAFSVGPEVTVKVREGRYWVPDLVVQAKASIQSLYPSVPVHLCVEIMSPEDRFSATSAKCEAYYAWSV